MPALSQVVSCKQKQKVPLPSAISDWLHYQPLSACFGVRASCDPSTTHGPGEEDVLCAPLLQMALKRVACSAFPHCSLRDLSAKLTALGLQLRNSPWQVASCNIHMALEDDTDMDWASI
ncbi:trafficking protein particle complex subunit 9 [Platysternon megacephalum]|uniref:Trafficking protein particle complex subunit 9 n=1 Tax=Platysternon megacephalum TaxID=55544 RepID=A0A4D9E371_9SAUR|nr:trafficking protein particle complex subunit 9 [Platysternon megacephalum]